MKLWTNAGYSAPKCVNLCLTCSDRYLSNGPDAFAINECLVTKSA